MSLVNGSTSRGRGKKRKTVHFKGKLKPVQWAEFKAKLKKLVNHYQGLAIHVPRKAKRRKAKR